MQVREVSNKRQTYMIEVSSIAILTPRLVQELLTKNCLVHSVEVQQDLPHQKIEDVDSALKALVRVGYRALARAYHPDLGGDSNKMMLINRAKKELEGILTSVE